MYKYYLSRFLLFCSFWLTSLEASTVSIASLFGDIGLAYNTQISFQFREGTPPSTEIVTQVNTTGDISFSAGSMFVETGTDSAGEFIFQSKRVIRPFVPCGIGVGFSAVFLDGGVANSQQWIGLFDDENGIAVGYDGTDFSVLLRTASSDTIVNQASFNIDTINGLGSSEFAYDSTHFNMFRIISGPLGFSHLLVQILGDDGSWISFHEIVNSNVSQSAVFDSFRLPVRLHVQNASNTTNVRLGCNEIVAGSLGNNSNVARTRSFCVESLGKSLSNTEEHLVTIRNKETVNGNPNKVLINLLSLGGGNSEEDKQSIHVRLYRNTSVDELSFVDVKSDESVVEKSTNGIFTGNSDTPIFTQRFGGWGSVPALTFLKQISFVVDLYPGDTLTLTGETSSGFVESVIGFLMWEELY